MIDFYASEPGYADHLLPIWWALEPWHRGTFFAVGKAEAIVRLEVGNHFRRRPPRDSGPTTVVAAYQDLRVIQRRQVVLLNHGAGQSYKGDRKTATHPSYVGGTGRQKVALFLEPGPIAAQATREAGGKNVVEIGCPKLDPFLVFPRKPNPESVVAVSWHWPLPLCPETMWAWPEYKDVTVALAGRHKVIGHAHPRAWQRLKAWYEQVGIEPVERFSEVLTRADVYVCDNSSTMYEAAAVGIPVVALNSKEYRRDVEHGLRFWSHIPGEQVDRPEDLDLTVTYALRVREDYSAVLQNVYSHSDGNSARRAVQAILELGEKDVGSPDPYKPTRQATRSEPEPVQPQFPLARLHRIGASTKAVQEARKIFDSMETDEEKYASISEFEAMSDVELREALEESAKPEPKTVPHGSVPVTDEKPEAEFDPEAEPETVAKEVAPKVNEMTIPQVLKWVGNSKIRAGLAMDAERGREDRQEGRGRSTLFAKLEKVIDG